MAQRVNYPNMDDAFMNNIVMRMRLYQRNDNKEHPINNPEGHQTIGNVDKTTSNSQDTSTESDDNNATSDMFLHCDTCCFPKYCKRGPFLCHRFLCLCDIDVGVVGEIDWLKRTSELFAKRQTLKGSGEQGRTRTQQSLIEDIHKARKYEQVDSEYSVDGKFDDLLSALAKAVDAQATLKDTPLFESNDDAEECQSAVCNVQLSVQQNANNSSSSDSDFDTVFREDDFSQPTICVMDQGTEQLVHLAIIQHTMHPNDWSFSDCSSSSSMTFNRQMDRTIDNAHRNMSSFQCDTNHVNRKNYQLLKRHRMRKQNIRGLNFPHDMNSSHCKTRTRYIAELSRQNNTWNNSRWQIARENKRVRHPCLLQHRTIRHHCQDMSSHVLNGHTRNICRKGCPTSSRARFNICSNCTRMHNKQISPDFHATRKSHQGFCLNRHGRQRLGYKIDRAKSFHLRHHIASRPCPHECRSTDSCSVRFPYPVQSVSTIDNSVPYVNNKEGCFREMNSIPQTCNMVLEASALLNKTNDHFPANIPTESNTGAPLITRNETAFEFSSPEIILPKSSHAEIGGAFLPLSSVDNKIIEPISGAVIPNGYGEKPKALNTATFNNQSLSDSILKTQDISTNVNSNNNDQPINNNSSNRPAELRGRVVKVEGDGRCLFRSLVTAEWAPLQAGKRDDFGRPDSLELAKQEKTRADLLRARVVSVMTDNLHFYSQLSRTVVNADQPVASSYLQFRDRLSAMSDPSTMPGDLEINAVALVLERQILVLNTNLALITSYGADRFPQSTPLAVRFTRLGPDVGHYDAVILDNNQCAAQMHHATIKQNISKMDCTGNKCCYNTGHWGSSVDGDLCGHFNKLTTSEGSDGYAKNMRLISYGCASGDTTLKAKREYFYLRDQDKALHTEDLKPVQCPTETGAPNTNDTTDRQRIEASTSTTRAKVIWPPQEHEKIKRCHSRYKARKFTDKNTQTDWENEGPRFIIKPKARVKRAGNLKSRKRSTRSHVHTHSLKTLGHRHNQRGAASDRNTGEQRYVPSSRSNDSGNHDLNWNSRPSAKTQKQPVTSLRISGRKREKIYGDIYCQSVDEFPSEIKMVDGCLFYKPLISWGKVKTTTLNEIKKPTTSSTNRFTPKSIKRIRDKKMCPGKMRKPLKKSSPTTYISVCAPTNVKPVLYKPKNFTKKPPQVLRPQLRKRLRRGDKRGGLSPRLSPHTYDPPRYLPSLPRLPDALTPAQCRCLYCEGAIELSAKGCVKCFLCGRLAHRACVIKEPSHGGRGGGDQNYFLCYSCTPP